MPHLEFLRYTMLLFFESFFQSKVPLIFRKNDFFHMHRRPPLKFTALCDLDEFSWKIFETLFGLFFSIFGFLRFSVKRNRSPSLEGGLFGYFVDLWDWWIDHATVWQFRNFFISGSVLRFFVVFSLENALWAWRITLVLSLKGTFIWTKTF